jgi:class 3 adenylate cyclase
VKLSLRAKWTAVLLAVALLPLAMLALRMLHVQRAGLRLAEEELEVAVVHEGALASLGLLGRSAGTVRSVAARLADARIENEDTRLLLARDSFAEDPSLEYVAIFGPDRTYIDAIAKKGVNVPSTPAFPPGDAADGTGGWSFAIPGSPEFVMPIRTESPGAKLTGYLVGHLGRDVLPQAVAEIAETRLRSKDRLVVLDGSLHVLAGSALAVGSDDSKDPLLLATHVDGATAGKPFIVTTEFADGEVPMVGTVVSFPESKLLVLARRPESEAFGALANARRSVLLALLVVAVVVLAVATFVAGRTTRPIAELSRVARAYGKRDLGALPDVHTGDELEELGTQMTAMAKGLRAGEDEIARHAVVEAGLSRYLPQEVAQEIASGKGSLELGGRRRRIVVVFADIVSFTSYAERAEPEQVVALLNEVFTLLSEVVFRERGMVDKFMGDCIMAVFGAHRDEDFASVCESALRAADDMHQFVEASRLRLRARYGADVSLGIGVAAGEAIVGNLGSESRMEFTVIGDAVNLASRLEGLARPGQTLCSPGLLGRYGELASLGKHGIRGKREPIELFELLT